MRSKRLLVAAALQNSNPPRLHSKAESDTGVVVFEESNQAVAVLPEKANADLDRRPKRQPPYHVILLDDDDHTYDYVIDMLRKIFGITVENAFQLAEEVDNSGRVILDTTTFERAELKRDQIHSFGKDPRITRCQGSMTSTIEPAPE